MRFDVDGRWMEDAALAIRRRCIDYFIRRDVLKLAEYQRIDAIKAGNIIAHHGNALSDAYLFRHDNRRDTAVYTHLYGFDFATVLDYYEKGIDGGIFSVLNAYSTLLMQSAEGKEPSFELKQAFQDFVLRANMAYPSTPQDHDNSVLVNAYWKFWKVYEQHKK